MSHTGCCRVYKSTFNGCEGVGCVSSTPDVAVLNTYLLTRVLIVLPPSKTDPTIYLGSLKVLNLTLWRGVELNERSHCFAV